MLGDQPVMAFVPSADLDRSREFYGGTLDLPVMESTPYALVLGAAGGAMVRVTRVDGFQPQPFTVLGWDVTDLDAELGVLRAAGVDPLEFPGVDQDARGVWTTPGGDQVLWFHDPDGNVLSLTQFA